MGLQPFSLPECWNALHLQLYNEPLGHVLKVYMIVKGTFEKVKLGMEMFIPGLAHLYFFGFSLTTGLGFPFHSNWRGRMYSATSSSVT